MGEEGNWRRRARFWDVIAVIGIAITLIFVTLEFIGFFKGSGIAGAILGILVIFVASWQSTKSIFERIGEESRKTRNELGEKMDSLGEKMDGMTKILEEVRDKL
jgi:hypothetical protein